MVRELTGGLYFGQPSERMDANGESAVVDTLFYKKAEMKRVIEKAFVLADKRRKKSHLLIKQTCLNQVGCGGKRQRKWQKIIRMCILSIC